MEPAMPWLREAPMPTAVLIAPRVRLKRPVPCVRSAITRTETTPNIPAPTPSRIWSRPIDTAAMTLPAELKVWLRPWRRSNNRCPTIPSETAQMAGPKILDVPPIRTCADITNQKVGASAISNAPAANATIPAAIRARLDRRRSTSAPAGVCVRIPAIPPTVSASPTRLPPRSERLRQPLRIERHAQACGEWPADAQFPSLPDCGLQVLPRHQRLKNAQSEI